VGGTVIIFFQRCYTQDQVLVLRPFRTSFWRSHSWSLGVWPCSWSGLDTVRGIFPLLLWKSSLVQLNLVIFFPLWEIFFCTALYNLVFCVVTHLFCFVLLLSIFYFSAFCCVPLNSLYCAGVVKKKLLTHSLTHSMLDIQMFVNIRCLPTVGDCTAPCFNDETRSRRRESVNDVFE